MIKKRKIIVIAFWLLIFFAIYSIFTLIKSNFYSFNIKNLTSPLKPITLNLELNKNYTTSSFLICYNDICKSTYTDDFYNVYSSKFDDKIRVKNIYIAHPFELKNFKNDINLIDLHIGNDGYYYKKEDISKFTKKKFSIKFDNKEEKIYSAIELPQADNYRGVLNHISVIFLSLFYNWQIFIVPYFWLFVAFLLFIYNKDKFSAKSKPHLFVLMLILAIGLFLRLVDITYYPFWTDEVYTASVAIENFKSCFLDPGNPPLFFILEFLVSKISSSDLFLRLIPCLAGALMPLAAYFLFKDFSKKEALFVAFLAAINTINIYHSQEARGYSLCMLLSLWSIYFLFKYLKRPCLKNLVYYSTLLILTINLNYYLILFAISNFIWAIVSLIEDKKEIKPFFAANLLSFLTFLPYFIISSSKAVSNGFNGWIEPLSKETFLYTINAYFINKYIFIFLCVVLLINIILCFLPSKIANKNKQNLLIYLIYSITLVLILASLISIFIKPIVHKRVLLSLYSLLFTTEAMTIVSVVEVKKLNKIFSTIYFLVLTFFYFSITAPMPLRELCNVFDFMNFIKNDSTRYESNYEIYAITSNTKEYLKYYPETNALKNINWRFIDTNNGSVLSSIKKTDFTKSTNKKIVIYFNSIGVDTESIGFLNPDVRIYPSNLTTSAKIVYE